MPFALGRASNCYPPHVCGFLRHAARPCGAGICAIVLGTFVVERIVTKWVFECLPQALQALTPQPNTQSGFVFCNAFGTLLHIGNERGRSC